MNIQPQPPIDLFGIRIDEPVTTLTDLMVSAVCFYAFFHLAYHPYRPKSKVHWYLQIYFLSMGIATAIGGLIGHAFLYLFSFAWKLPGWLTSMISIALVERAAIQHARKFISKKVGDVFAWVNIIELLTFIALTFTTLNFFFVEVHSAYGLLVVVASFSFITYIKSKSRASGIFLIAVAFSAISALFFMNEWSLHTWFNYLDISHTFMTISAFFFYKGALQMIEENNSGQDS